MDQRFLETSLLTAGTHPAWKVTSVNFLQPGCLLVDHHGPLLVSRICPAWMACMFGKSEQESYKPRFNPTDPQSAQSAKGRALAVSLLDKEH